MCKQKRSWLWATIVLILALSLAWGCGTPTPEPVQTEEPTAAPTTVEVTSTPDTAEIEALCKRISDAGRQAQAEIPDGLEVAPYEGLMYVAGQVIVSGLPGDIDDVIARLPFSLTPSNAEPLELGNDNVARLYQIPSEISVEEAVCLINALGSDVGVAGDPNYHMSPANEWAGGASPWTQNGGWTVGVPGGGLAEAQASAFESQWALDQNSGIDLYDTTGQRLRPETDGKDIRIGIFDTSPYTTVIPYGTQKKIGPADLIAHQVQLSPAHLSWTLTVSHPLLIPAPACPGVDRHTGKSLEDQDISDHGLFVAGLVHAAAPDSDIRLVRVLEDDGCGTLFSIAGGIQAFMRQAEADGVQNVVLNLSLGVHKPPDPVRFGLPKKVPFLEDALGYARDQGAVIVAAAGNDAYPDRDPSSGMELPAAYDFVIGVTASNADRARGCFSNFQPGAPNVAAPGGDGEKPASEEAEWFCHLPDCNRHPEACLVSLSYQSDTGYAYWVGTSFATPLVTGQVALSLGSPSLTPVSCPWDDTHLVGSDSMDIISFGASCP
jgi:subtilisin family serine protease